MAQIELPKWLCDDGWRIDELLRRDGVMARFREMLGKWADETLRQRDEQKAWQKQRDRHFAKVSKNPRLQDAKTKPPMTPTGERWRFTCGKGNGLSLIWGWCPPDLDEDKKPDIDDPLSGYYDPNDRPVRAPSLPEKYVACALIHDACCMGRERINPWTNASQENDRPKWLLRMRYEALVGDVVKLPDRARPAAEACLTDIEADLQQAGLVDKAPPKRAEEEDGISISEVARMYAEARSLTSDCRGWIRQVIEKMDSPLKRLPDGTVEKQSAIRWVNAMTTKQSECSIPASDANTCPQCKKPFNHAPIGAAKVCQSCFQELHGLG